MTIDAPGSLLHGSCAHPSMFRVSKVTVKVAEQS